VIFGFLAAKPQQMTKSEFFIDFIERLEDVFYIIEYPSLVVKYVSPSVVFRGYSLEEIYSEPGIMHKRLSPEQVQLLSKLAEESLEKGPIHGEYSRQIKPGETKWYQNTMKLIKAEDGTLLLMGFNRDITTRKNSEFEYQQLTAEYEDLYNKAPNGYHSIDENGVILRINDTALNWLGYSREELVGKKINDILLTPANQQFFANQFQRFKSEGFAKDVRLEFLRKDGSILHCLLNATSVKDENGKMLFSRSIFTDITLLKEGEEKLKRSHVALDAINEELKLANLKLERLNFTKDILLKIISHDLRNPLETIKLISTLLNEKYNELDMETVTKYLQYISQTSLHATDLLESMTSMIQLGSDVSFDVKDTAIEPLIEEAIGFNKGRAADKGIVLRFDKPLNLDNLIAKADDKWLIRAIDNLIANALKFSNKGDEVKIECHTNGHKVVITISDNGIGMPSEILSKLFNRLSVPSRQGTAGETGTGIGLSIVKQIVDMQSGEIAVNSIEGMGSSFEISLPAAN
jgi:PAS domain S-box-containing protein